MGISIAGAPLVFRGTSGGRVVAGFTASVGTTVCRVHSLVIHTTGFGDGGVFPPPATKEIPKNAGNPWRSDTA